MAHAPVPNAVQRDRLEQSESIHHLAADTCFGWSHAKIRRAAFVLLAAAAPAAIAFALPDPYFKWLCLAWLTGVALFMHGLSRRTSADAVVLWVDQTGIIDRRLMSKYITWQEISAIWPVDTGRSSVVELELRWPKITLAETRWSVRIGAYCQIWYGVPAVTLSMLLLDGNVCDLLNAIAQYRPDLLHCTNRQVPPAAAGRSDI